MLELVGTIFEGQRIYRGKYSVKSVRRFTPQEIGMIEKAQVVPSEYGSSCCFFFKNGESIYFPMSNDAKSREGDLVDLNTAEIVVLEKAGEKDIIRIRG